MIWRKATETIKKYTRSEEPSEALEDSREERKKRGKSDKHKYRVRLIPIWLRLIIVVFLLAGSLVAGTMVGYGVVGKGKPMDVFHKKTWEHIYNIVYEDVGKNKK